MAYSKRDLERMKISLNITDEDYKLKGKRKYFSFLVENLEPAGLMKLTYEEYETADINYIVNKAKDNMYNKIIDDMLNEGCYALIGKHAHNGTGSSYFSTEFWNKIKHHSFEEVEYEDEIIDVLKIKLTKENPGLNPLWLERK